MSGCETATVAYGRRRRAVERRNGRLFEATLSLRDTYIAYFARIITC